MKSTMLKELINAKLALNSAEERYSQIKERFIASYGAGEYQNDKAKVLITEGIRNNIAYAKVVKDLLPEVNLKKYTTKTPYTIVNVTMLGD